MARKRKPRAVTPEQQARRDQRAKDRAERIALRDELAQMTDKVPAIVQSGSIQTTRSWVSDNKVSRRMAKCGTLDKLRAHVIRMRLWKAGQRPA